MAQKTLNEIKKIETDIFLALQILRNEIETLAIIKEHSIEKNSFTTYTNRIIQEEIEESISNIEQLINLHKNLDGQINKLEDLVQDLFSAKA